MGRKTDRVESAGTLAAGVLLPDPLPAEPFALFNAWFDQAHQQKVQPNPNAMTVATVDPGGGPSARVLLCKAIDTRDGFIVFYTNRRSRKGKALARNPEAAAVFHWDVLDRQARIEGQVVESPDAESDEYFATRPWESQVAAWASEQSEPVASRADLLHQVAATMARLGIVAGVEPGSIRIPRPPHWGGYRLYARRVELWAAGAGRVHDRAAWTRTLRAGPEGPAGGPWEATRLQP